MPTEVQIIDAQIDGIRRELYRRVGFRPLDAYGFHNAWRRCPDLKAREYALFCQRYDAKVRQDRAEDRAASRQKRAERAAFRKTPIAKCPTCGFHTIAAA